MPHHHQLLTLAYSDPDVIRAGAEPIGGKSNASLLVFPFPDIISQVKAFKI